MAVPSDPTHPLRLTPTSASTRSAPSSPPACDDCCPSVHAGAGHAGNEPLATRPGIQEAILFLPDVEGGRDAVKEWQVRPVAAEVDWGRQRRAWWRLVDLPSTSTRAFFIRS
jgi:hypothetical protein